MRRVTATTPRAPGVPGRLAPMTGAALMDELCPGAVVVFAVPYFDALGRRYTAEIVLDLSASGRSRLAAIVARAARRPGALWPLGRIFSLRVRPQAPPDRFRNPPR